VGVRLSWWICEYAKCSGVFSMSILQFTLFIFFILVYVCASGPSHRKDKCSTHGFIRKEWCSLHGSTVNLLAWVVAVGWIRVSTISILSLISRCHVDSNDDVEERREEREAATPHARGNLHTSFKK